MSESQIDVLLVEDNPGDARLLRETLADIPAAHLDWTHTTTLADAIQHMKQRRFQVALLDLSLPDSHGLDTFVKINRQDPDLPVVMLTGLDDESVAYEAMQKGAQDYLVKGNVDGHVLMRSIRYAIERSRRRQAEKALRARDEESRVAREIQQKLFPSSAPHIPGYDIAGASHPAEATGGDYYDHILMPDGTVAIVIADVSSHGFGPALVMAETRAYLRALMLTRTDVGEVLNLVNRALISDTNDDVFVTLLLARIDPATGELVYVSAGHPTGYVIDSAGQMKRELKSTSLPLGIEPAGVFTAAEPVQLAPGDLVVLLTDGVLEAARTDKTMFGIERTIETVRAHRDKPAAEIVDAMYRSVSDFCQQQCNVDDITAVVLKVLKQS